VGFYDYETGGGHTAKKGSVGKIYHIWGPPAALQRRQGGPFPIEATVDFPDGSAGIFGFDDLEIINEDIFQPASNKDLTKRRAERVAKAKAMGRQVCDKCGEVIDGATYTCSKCNAKVDADCYDPVEHLCVTCYDMKWHEDHNLREDIFKPATPKELGKRKEAEPKAYDIYIGDQYDGRVLSKEKAVDIAKQYRGGRVYEVPESSGMRLTVGSAKRIYPEYPEVVEDIFKPAKRGEVKKRKRTFDKSAEGAREQFNKIRSDFSAMMHEFTRNDEDPPEYLIELGKEMRWLSKEIIPEDPESALDILNRAKELLRQLRVFVTGEDVSEDIFKSASGEEVKRREEEHAEKVGYAPFRRIVNELDKVLDKKTFSADDNLTWLNIFDNRSNNVIVSVELFEDETDEGASVIKVENHWELGQDAYYDVGYEKNIEKNVVNRTMKALKDYLEDKNAGTGSMPNR
jgi:hypothetical protein